MPNDPMGLDGQVSALEQAIADLRAQVATIAGRLDTLTAARVHPQEPRLGPRPLDAADTTRMVDELVAKVREDVASPPPVDRSQVTSTSGRPPSTVRAEQTAETGQHADYIVLSDAERHKGFVRPVRRTYVHGTCGVATSMGQALAETYARDPKFYSHTFCVSCNRHLPVSEFRWDDGTVVGS